MHGQSFPKDHITEYSDADDERSDDGGADGIIDSELQAAIEYKIATDGLKGVARVLELLDEAVRRHV